jgi:hypothetical protein
MNVFNPVDDGDDDDDNDDDDDDDDGSDSGSGNDDVAVRLCGVLQEASKIVCVVTTH